MKYLEWANSETKQNGGCEKMELRGKDGEFLFNGHIVSCGKVNKF